MAHRPIFDVHIYPVHQTVKVGHNVTFDCIAKSDTELSYGYAKVVTEGNNSVLDYLDVSLIKLNISITKH